MATNYWELFVNSYKGYARYFWHEMTHPDWNNYFYWLIGVSLFFFVLEIVIPWRKKQPIPRKDFWLDTFYMFFRMLIPHICYGTHAELHQSPYFIMHR